MASLQDADPEVASDAARCLGQYGSSKAEQALWARYEAWSQEWAGRDSELRFVFSAKNPHVFDAGLGQNLARSLARGTAWISDDAKLRCIEALGVGPNIKADTEQAIREWNNKPFTIFNPTAEPPIFRVAQYELHSLDALKTKLNEFPTGTVFTFQDAPSQSSEQNNDLYNQLSEFGKERGVTIARAPLAKDLNERE